MTKDSPDARDLPAFVQGAIRAPAKPAAKPAVFAESVSQGTTRTPGPGGLDIRRYDMTRFAEREALHKFISWAIVNGFTVTIRPASDEISTDTL